MPAKFLLFVVLTAFLCVVPACNVFEGTYEEGSSDDPAVLLQDASYAMQNDEPEKAVTLLRKARSLAPAGGLLHTRATIGLSAALMQSSSANSAELMIMARKLTKAPAATQAKATSKHLAEVCSFEGERSRAAFDPRDVTNYPNLVASAETMAEAQRLADEVLAGTNADVEAFDCTSESVLEGVTRLQNMGLSDLEIADLLLNDAVAHATRAYLDVSSAGGNQASFYYVTGQNDVEYIGYCFPDAETCASTADQLRQQMQNMRCARELLTARAGLLGGSTPAELASLVDDAYTMLDEGLQQATCTASAD